MLPLSWFGQNPYSRGAWEICDFCGLASADGPRKFYR
jgi:hypothetical protein